MVMLRNIYQDYIADNPQLFRDYDFTIIWDMDIIGTFYIDGLASSGYIFKTHPEVSSLCANGLKITNMGLFVQYTYADPYAHGDMKNHGGQGLRKASDFWVVWPEQCSSDKKTKKVSSCFNGMVLYRKANLDGKKYTLEQDLDNPGDTKCEHRTLNEQMSGMYINKQMIYVILRQ